MAKNLRKVFNNLASVFELAYPVYAPFAEAGKAVVKNNGNVAQAAKQSVVQQETQGLGDVLSNTVNEATGAQPGSLGATTTDLASQLLAQKTVSPALSKALGAYPKAPAPQTSSPNISPTSSPAAKPGVGGASGGVGQANVSMRPQIYPWVRPGEATPAIKTDSQGIS